MTTSSSLSIYRLCLVVVSLASLAHIRMASSLSMRFQTSNFLGLNYVNNVSQKQHGRSSYHPDGDNAITMRKQKASNKRTRRLQRGGKDEFDMAGAIASDFIASSLKTPTATSSWNYKTLSKTKNSDGSP